MLRWLLLGLVATGGGACHLIVAFDAPVPVDAAMAAENCDDGIDNDGDGLVDCQDPDCQPDHECVPEAPSGFSLRYTSSAAEGACPAGGTPEQVLTVGTPTCDISSCSCGAPGGACGVNAGLYASACMGGTATNVSMVPGMCYSNLGGSTSGSFAATSGGVSCAPAGAAKTTPAPGPAPLSLCPVAQPSSGCAAGQVCVRRGTGGFANVCAVASGDQACPADRPQRTVVGSAVNDLRTCACGCSSAMSCSTVQVNLYGNGSCAGPSSESDPATAVCTVFQSIPGSMRIRFGVTLAPCAPTATVSGVFTVNDEATVCCAP